MPWQGKTNEEVLAAWDRNEPVWSCSMGGMGPGYEQCIHLMGFEMLRAMLTNPVKDWSEFEKNQDLWKKYRDKIEKTPAVDSIVDKLGPSGAQFGAAMNLAMVFCRNGYSKGMEMVPQDRRILVNKEFPTLV